MRTVILDQANVAALVPEEHQILAKHSDEFGGGLLGYLTRGRHRQPVAPQPLARRSTWPHLREKVVLLFGEHLSLSSRGSPTASSPQSSLQPRAYASLARAVGSCALM